MGRSRNRPSIRVYLCGVYGDTEVERDLLTKRVFPALRDECEKRNTTFVDVDLRWGISVDQAEQGETVPICLREIDECQFFVGLMGQNMSPPFVIWVVRPD
eukprot:TRINITY_DN3931_c0_g1_i6.p1 TRINITY_DN3931_c0_g1~~TRINITY_DN3931_c0_g1_i6.p1  ORF type:complete len:101 (+),score=2.65 TRINITY_DN3931_c0_g1_i6:412-714(+)